MTNCGYGVHGAREYSPVVRTDIRDHYRVTAARNGQLGPHAGQAGGFCLLLALHAPMLHHQDLQRHIRVRPSPSSHCQTHLCCCSTLNVSCSASQALHQTHDSEAKMQEAAEALQGPQNHSAMVAVAGEADSPVSCRAASALPYRIAAQCTPAASETLHAVQLVSDTRNATRSKALVCHRAISTSQDPTRIIQRRM